MTNTNTTAPADCVDVTPPGCDLFAGAEAGAPVLLLNAKAPPDLLLGFVYGRCCELRKLAELSACSHDDEGGLKEAARHVWQGLDTVLEALECLSERLPNAPASRVKGGAA